MVDEITIRPFFTFPQNRQAFSNEREAQVMKITEEVGELNAEMLKQPIDWVAVCREAWDVVQATEGLLRTFDNETCIDGFQGVLGRCLARGDYE
jgi:hypothetical protein